VLVLVAKGERMKRLYRKVSLRQGYGGTTYARVSLLTRLPTEAASEASDWRRVAVREGFEPSVGL
jgi:hypothetical protein